MKDLPLRYKHLLHQGSQLLNSIAVNTEAPAVGRQHTLCWQVVESFLEMPHLERSNWSRAMGCSKQNARPTLVAPQPLDLMPCIEAEAIS